MNFWTVFWGVLILFSILGFTIMSAKILYKGFGEFKEMIQTLMKINK